MPTFFTPVDVSPTADGTYNDVDITAQVGADAGNIAMAILQVENVHATLSQLYALRENGSTDDRYADMEDDGHTWHYIGCDSSDVFEAKLEDANVHLWLVGYWTTAEAASITNGVDKSLGSTGSFIDIDITADVPSGTATAAMFQVDHQGDTSNDYGFRENGSTDDRKRNIFGNDMHGAWMAVDADEIVEAFTDNLDIDFFLIGYALSNFTSLTNGTEHSTGTTGSYQVTDLSSSIPAGNNGAACQFYPTGDTEYSCAIRKNGESGFDQDADVSKHSFLIVNIDSDRKIEQQIENTALNLWIWGYTAPSGAVVIFRRRIQGY